MSVDCYAFLGKNLEMTEFRLLQEFKKAGFHVELHPDFEVLSSNKKGECWIKILSTPLGLIRASSSDYIVGFGYSVLPRNLNESLDEEWPPKKVIDWTYQVCTMTSAGRSKSAYYMQAFTAAILAKISGGVFYDPDQDKVIKGTTAVSNLKKSIKEIESKKLERMAHIESLINARDANKYRLIEILLSQELEFDVGGYEFRSWPSLEIHEHNLGKAIQSQTPVLKLPKPKVSNAFFTKQNIALYLFAGFLLLLTLYYS